MKVTTLRHAALVLVAPLLLSSCGGNKAKEENKASDTTAAVVSQAPNADSAKLAEKQAADFLQNLPSPVHVARILKKSGLKYVNGLANATESASKYVSNESKALNLGVYSADLAYAAMNAQSAVAGKYFKSVNTLADGLNLGTVFETNGYAKRFEANLSNQDSLVRLMAELQSESDMLLKQTNRYEIVYMSFAGAWTESIYLATKIYASQASPELGNRIAQQGPIVAKLVNLLKSETSPAAQSTVKSLEEIQVILDKLSTVGKPSSPEFQKVFKEELTPKMEALRKSIVEMA